MKNLNDINLTTTFEDKFSDGINKIVINAKPFEYLKAFKVAFIMFPKNKKLESCVSWFMEKLDFIEKNSKLDAVDSSIVVPDEHRIVMGSIWTYMILFGSKVSVFCEKCNDSIYSIHLKMNQWHFLIEETDTFMYGKQFVCPEGHVLFKNEEWRMYTDEK